MGRSMASALFELEANLRSRKENLTSQEANILMQWKTNAFRGFVLGLTGGSVLTWLVSWKLGNLLRINLTAVSGLALGTWNFRRCVDSGADYILSLEGTRVQKELGTLMVRKYQHVPGITKRVSRNFYMEEVYDDSSDQPRLRWRFRNFFGESANDSAGTSDSHVDKSNRGTAGLKDINPHTRKDYQANHDANDKMGNAFDCIFGLPMSEESSSESSRASPRRPNRVHRRSLRRQRRLIAETSDA